MVSLRQSTLCTDISQTLIGKKLLNEMEKKQANNMKGKE